jgi:hypothetical protein
LRSAQLTFHFGWRVELMPRSHSALPGSSINASVLESAPVQTRLAPTQRRGIALFCLIEKFRNKYFHFFESRPVPNGRKSLGAVLMKFDQARQFALALPEVIEAPHFQSISFRVSGKIFATAPPDGLYLHLFVSEAEREAALEMYPEFAEKLFWGAKVAGLRVILSKAKSALVKHLLHQAWKNEAPKRLLAKTTE